MRSSKSFSIRTVFSALILFFIAGMPMIAGASDLAPGTTLSADNLTLSAEIDQNPYLGGCSFNVQVTNSGEVAYPLDNCTVTVYDGASEYRAPASGIVLPRNMATKNIPVNYNGAHIMRDNQMKAIHTPLAVALFEGQRMVAIASLKEGVNLAIIRNKGEDGYGSFAALEAWYATPIDRQATISDNNLSLGAQEVLYAGLAGASTNILIYNHGEVAYPLDGCTATVYTKTGEYTINLGGIVLPLGIAPKVVGIDYADDLAEKTVYGPTAVQINDAQGNPIAMASLKKGVNLEEVGMPAFGSTDGFAKVIYE